MRRVRILNVCLLVTALSGVASAQETAITALGGSTRFAAPLKSVDDLRKLTARREIQTDLSAILVSVGRSDVVAAARR